MVSIALQSCKINCIIGCEPQERIAERELFCDVKFTLFENPLIEDSLSHTIDYVEIYQAIAVHLRENSFYLIEYAVTSLTRMLLDRFSKIREVSITLRKPYPCVGIQETSATMTLNRSQNGGLSS